VGVSGGRSRVNQQRLRYGVLDDINGYLDVAIVRLPHTPNDNPSIKLELVVVNHVLELIFNKG
jgi:hypothetical protein